MENDNEQNDTNGSTEKPRHAFRTGRRVLMLTWQQRPMAVIAFAVGALLEIAGSLMSMYATAKLGSLLARYITGAHERYAAARAFQNGALGYDRFSVCRVTA